jgi:hypothetical protein
VYSDWLRAGWLSGQSWSPSRDKIFLLSTSFRPALGPAQPTIRRVPGVRLLECEVEHSPPTRTEVKNTWIYTSTLSYVLMV